MRTAKLLLIISSGIALAGCGSADEPPATPPAAQAQSGSKSSSNSRIAATAAEVAAEARGKLRCPAKIATPSRDPSLPVDDVVGVRPGLSFDEARNIVLCSHDLLVASEGTGRGFKINSYGQTLRQGFSAQFAEDRVNKTSKEIMAEMQDAAMARSSNRRAADMPGGTSRWYVTTMGMPNAERVLAAARIEAFSEGKSPTMSGVADALVQKYGTPSQRQENPGSWNFSWGYDLRDRPITETSPMFYQCRGTSNPDSGVNLSPDCGLVITAQILPLRDNPQMARTLEVGVVNQAQGYELLTATQQGLENLEQSRRAAETRAASQNAEKPTL